MHLRLNPFGSNRVGREHDEEPVARRQPFTNVFLPVPGRGDIVLAEPGVYAVFLQNRNQLLLDERTLVGCVADEAGEF